MMATLLLLRGPIIIETTTKILLLALTHSWTFVVYSSTEIP